MSRIKIISICSIVSIAVLSVYCGKTSTVSVKQANVRIKFVKGTVKVFSSNGIVKARLGQVLESEDRIFTSAHSSAELVLKDTGIIKLGPKSSLKVSVLIKENGVVNADLQLNRGTVLTAVQKLKSTDTFRMKTPTAVAGVRGTAFITEVNAEEKAVFPYGLRDAVIEKPTTSVSVLTGKVAVKDSFGSEVVLERLKRVVTQDNTRLTKNSIIPIEKNAISNMKKLLIVEGDDAFSTAFLVKELKSVMSDDSSTANTNELRQNEALKSRKKVKIRREAGKLEEDLNEEDLKLKSNKVW